VTAQFPRGPAIPSPGLGWLAGRRPQGGADGPAEALARRADTRWVHLTSGGTGVICLLEARSAQQRDALFLHGLPGSRRLVQVTAYLILPNYTAFRRQGIRQALSGGQLSAPAGHEAPVRSQAMASAARRRPARPA